MAILTVVTPVLAGVDPGLTAATMAGDSFPNTGKEIVLVVNGATDTIITFDSPNTCDFDTMNAAHDEVDTTSAASERLVGPFPKSRFNDANGRVQMTSDDDSNVTLAIIKMI